MNVRRTLEERISKALAAAGAPAGSPAIVIPGKAGFGDYQANGVMAAAKAIKTNPRALAQAVVAQLGAGGAGDVSELAQSVEIAGPGFINITLKSDWLAGQLMRQAGDKHLGVEQPTSPQTVVVDYSGPNLAKEMHVGHLRSTIIGDALAHVLEFQGQKVIRQNHVGDWGTQFGMLIAYQGERIREHNPPDNKEANVVREWPSDITTQPLDIFDGFDFSIKDMEEFYREAKKRFDTDPKFATRSRKMVVDLQSGESVRNLWKFILEESLKHCEQVYAVLGVSLNRDDVRGESAYNGDLPSVIADLRKAGLLQESQGAQCVFLPEFKGKDGEPLPLIVQKSDGGYLYATTDLAAIRYRAGVLHGERVLYVTDSRQALHFKQVFSVAKAAGFAPAAMLLEHVPFGTMLGQDGKPFKTRTGGTVKLMDLLAEAEVRAYALVSEKNPELPEAERKTIAQAVGIGAVKYADLAQNRASDYVFAWDKMLSLEGNTAPYMQYAYARIKSIFRKGEIETSRDHQRAELVVSEPAERALAVKLLQFVETIDVVAAECLPSVLCAYLYDLAGAFTAFYEHCPVLKSDEPVRDSRLELCYLTARVIETGLGLLGIETIEQM